MQPATSAAHFVLGVRIEDDERILDAPVGRVGHVRDAREAVERDVVPARARGRARAASGGAAPRSRRTTRRSGRPPRARPRRAARPWRRARRRAASLARCRCRRFSISRSRCAQRVDQQRAAASGCRAGRPADRDCARRPRCRPAPRRACAPSGRCGARRAARPARATSASPSRRITISRSENDV